MNFCLFYIRRCFGLSGNSMAFPLGSDNGFLQAVTLDSLAMGNEVLILKNGQRICGTGSALGNNPITQNKAYFEVKVQQDGVWSVGLTTRDVDLNRVPLAANQPNVLFCILNNDGQIIMNGKQLYQYPEKIHEGDIIAITYDHVEMCLYINNQKLDYCATGLKGEFYPILTVDSGAILDASFSIFQYNPPNGFDGILIEKSLL